MSSPTIKDVVIKVSIQAGTMNLDTSALKQQVSSAVSGIEKQLQTATSGMTVNSASQSGSSARSHPVLESWKQDIADFKVNVKKETEEFARKLEEENVNKHVEEAKKTNEAYKRSALDAAAGAAEFAKGLAFIAVAGDQSNESLARAVVTAQGYFNVIRGGMAVVGGAAGLIGGLAIAGGLIQRQLNMNAVENDRYEHGIYSSQAGITSQFAGNMVSHGTTNAMRRIAAIPDLRSMRLQAEHHQMRAFAENDIRRQQAASPRDFGAREEIRSREEREQSIFEQKRLAEAGLSHTTEQYNKLSAERERRKKQSKAAAVAHAEHIEKLENERRSKSGTSRIFGAITGQESDNSVEQFNTKLDQRIGKAKVERAKQLRDESEADVQYQTRLAELGQKRVDQAGQLLMFTREQVAAARQNYERDKESNDSAYRAIGGMSHGEQFILRQLEAKRRAGAKLEKWELMRSVPAGTKLHDYQRTQLEEEGRSSGLEVSADAAASKRKFEEADASHTKNEPATQDIITSQTKANEALDLMVKKAVDWATKQEKAFTEITATFEQVNKMLDNKLRELKQALAQ